MGIWRKTAKADMSKLWRKDNDMKLILSATLFFVVAIGLSYAYAEESKDFNIKVPFDYQSSGCTLVINQTDYKKYDCSAEWTGENHLVDGESTTPAEDGCTSGLDIDIRTGECKPFQWIEEEAKQLCYEDPECPVGIYDPVVTDPRLPASDERLDDQELIKKINSELENIKCFQGIGTTDGIQNDRAFPIPVIEVPVYKEVDGELVDTGFTKYEIDLSTPTGAIDLKGALKDIILRAFECNAQNTLLNPQGGVLSSADALLGYCDKSELLTVEQSIQAGCGVTSGSYYKSLSKIPIMTQDMANQKANFGIEKSKIRQSTDYVCNHNYSEGLRVAYGCPELPPIEKTVTPSMKDYHNNPVGQKYEQYLKDEGNDMSKQLAREAIEDKIAKLKESLRGFQ